MRRNRRANKEDVEKGIDISNTFLADSRLNRNEAFAYSFVYKREQENVSCSKADALAFLYGILGLRSTVSNKVLESLINKGFITVDKLNFCHTVNL